MGNTGYTQLGYSEAPVQAVETVEASLDTPEVQSEQTRSRVKLFLQRLGAGLAVSGVLLSPACIDSQTDDSDAMTSQENNQISKNKLQPTVETIENFTLFDPMIIDTDGKGMDGIQLEGFTGQETILNVELLVVDAENGEIAKTIESYEIPVTGDFYRYQAFANSLDGVDAIQLTTPEGYKAILPLEK